MLAAYVGGTKSWTLCPTPLPRLQLSCVSQASLSWPGPTTPTSRRPSNPGAGQPWPWGLSLASTLPGELRGTVLESTLSTAQECPWDQVLGLGSSELPSPSCSPRARGHLPLHHLYQSPSLSFQFGRNQVNICTRLYSIRFYSFYTT